MPLLIAGIGVGLFLGAQADDALEGGSTGIPPIIFWAAAAGGGYYLWKKLK